MSRGAQQTTRNGSAARTAEPGNHTGKAGAQDRSQLMPIIQRLPDSQGYTRTAVTNNCAAMATSRRNSAANKRCRRRCRSQYAEMSIEIPTFMRRLIDPYCRTVALASVVQFGLFLPWLCGRMRNLDVTRTFVEDSATSHLPRVCNLEKLCDEKGIETPPSRPPAG